jgi:hypothetical protein
LHGNRIKAVRFFRPEIHPEEHEKNISNGPHAPGLIDGDLIAWHRVFSGTEHAKS